MVDTNEARRLPLDEDFEWTLREITEAGGEGTIEVPLARGCNRDRAFHAIAELDSIAVARENDDARLSRSAAVFDDLHEWFQRKRNI